MVKLFVIDSADLEYHIYAMDIEDALNTYDGAIEDIVSIAEYENHTNQTLH